MGLKDLLGVTKYERNAHIETSIEKLHFLASEMERGNDRPTDYRFWKAEIDTLRNLNDKKSFALNKAIEAYEMLFRLFLAKHEIEGSEAEKSPQKAFK